MQESMATMYDEYGDGRTGKYGDARKDQHTARKDALAQQAKMENLGLDESEMMEYVMMLSREEASEREREAERMAELFGSSMAVDEGPTAFDTGPSAVHGRGFAADDGVFEGDFDEVPSPSVDDSSVLDTDDSPGSSGVSSLSYASSSGGPSIPGGPSPFGGPSPPPGPSSPPSGRPSPPHGQPIYPSPSLPSPPLAPASLDDPAVFPSISPQSPSSSMRASPSSSVRSAWSQPLKMSPTSSRKASFASSPSVKGTIARARTVTTSTRRVSASASGSGAWGSSGAGTGAWNTVTGATSTSASGAAARARTTSGGAWGTGSNNWVVTGPASPSVNAPAPPSIWPVTRSMTTPYSVVASSASGDVTQGHGVVRGMGTTDMGAMHHSARIAHETATLWTTHIVAATRK
ncbi:hypothetical protein BD626DRAFT_33814 [Schizophyllum amplum]|uniref:Uncharacterized protein n=1 Tax=Schizophyllum amplum TaxID=97359 RepID=A0A550CED4_9AGAR|nr:hypothetical protein BD626DRAFT_33814 [Auriculariopsis ampla]